MTKKNFAKGLILLANQGTGCSIQYNGSPCNSCFHAWAEDELDLHPILAHALWLVLLSVRGDYKKKEILEALISLEGEKK